MSFRQGYYTPRHPEKYIGDPTRIRYLSSWELEFHEGLDRNPNVLRWSSEPFYVPYIHPIDKKTHRYFPDYYVEYKNHEGQLLKEVLEIKPYRHAHLAAHATQYERISYAINIEKWKSATLFCKKHGLKFRFLTEKDIYRQGKVPNAKNKDSRAKRRAPSRTSSRYNNRNHRRRAR